MNNDFSSRSANKTRPWEPTPIAVSPHPHGSIAAMTMDDVTAALRSVLTEAHLLVGSPPAEPALPPGVRPSIRQMLALLVTEPSLTEVLEAARYFDLTDLNEREVAHIEQVHVKTVRSWRSHGGGPDFRDSGGIRYPIRWYLEWREKGRLSRTARPRR